MRKHTIIAAVLIMAMFATMTAACRPKVYTDGTYQAVSTADDHGYGTARVVIERDKIKSVELGEVRETGVEKDWATYPWAPAKTAVEQMPARFVAKNDWNVDIIAEATSSSNKYKEAVKFCLEKAKRKPTVTTTHFNGTFMGKSDEDRGWGVAWVTIQNDAITAVKVTDIVVDTTTGVAEEKDWDNYQWPEAVEGRQIMEQRFVAAGPAGVANVEPVAKATGSSNKWKQAVSRALASAKFK